MEDSCLSSPDPLANSIRTAASTERVTRRKSSRTRSRVPSEVARAQAVPLQNFVFDTPQKQRSFSSSPTRSSIKTENHLSPWRIRVTVEAERDDKNDGADIGYLKEADLGWKGKTSDSPGRGRTRRTRTTTTKVPLKGLESSPPTQKRRGRSKNPETPARPRNGTPAPKTRGRRKAAGNVPNGGDNNEDPDYLTPKRPKGRPRKSLVAAEEDAGAILDMERNDGAPGDTVILASPSPVKIKTTTKRTLENKKAKPPVRIAIDPDVQADDEPAKNSSEQTWDVAGHPGEGLGDINANYALSALADLSVNSIALVDAAQPDSLASVGDEDFGEQLDCPAGKFSPAKKTPIKLKQPRQAMGVDVGSASSNSIKHPSDLVPSESSVVSPSGKLQITDSLGYNTGSEPHVGDLGDLDNSVLDSEGFSMVSISSIATAGGYMSSPIPQGPYGDNVECDLVQSLAIMKLQSPSVHGDSTHRREMEGSLTQEEKWQLERYAVSRQIEMADSSQVIVINSDNEIAFSDGGDRESVEGESFIDPDAEYQIYRSQILQEQERQLQEDCQYTSELEIQGSKDLNDLFSNEDIKPRRGKIPSPWRADRQVIYSDEVEPGDDSDLLPQPRQGKEEEEQERGGNGEGKGKDVDAEEDEGPADLSVLLGLKSSPAKHSSGTSRSAGKSLRQRLIEKFYWAKQEGAQVKELTEAKPMEVSGRLVLHPSSKLTSHEDVFKGDGAPVLDLWGVNNIKSQVDKKLIEQMPPHHGKRAQQMPEIDDGESTQLDEVHVGKTLGARTYGPSPPGAHASVDDSTGSPTEQKPLTLKLLSARTKDDSLTEESYSAEESSFFNVKSNNAIEGSPAPHPEAPLTDPTRWLKIHWKTLDEFWFASKKQRRLSPKPPTYTTGNLPFHCPGQRSLFLNDDEMLVVREFVMYMQRRNHGEVYMEFDEEHVAQRLYSMIIGEESRRKQGEEYDEEGRWVGYGNSGNHPKY